MSVLDGQVGQGLCKKCGKIESQHFLIDDILYCDEPVVSANERITMGRMATIYNIPEEFHIIERKTEEEHIQLQKLAAMVRTLEKHCGISPVTLEAGGSGDDPATTVQTTLPSPPRSSLSAPRRSSLSHLSVNLGFADPGQDAGGTRGKCGGCGLIVLATDLRYVDGGSYYHLVSMLARAF